MTKIKVLAKCLTKTEVDAAIELVVASGYELNKIEVVADVGAPDPASDDELVLVIMTPAVCADTCIESELKKTPNGGRRAICVWPDGAPSTIKAPAAAANYAYSIIQWNVDKFRAVAADDDVMCFEQPDGTAMPKVKMEHNLCVEEKAKPV